MGGMNTAGGPDDMGRCSKTPATPYYSISFHTCVGCRYTGDDCVNANCDLDCEQGQRCDVWTNSCKLACDSTNGTENPCPKLGLVCDSSRFICVECDRRQGSLSGCAPNLLCSQAGTCVECNTSEDCHDAKHVCSFGECVECLSSYDCYDDAKPVCSFNECRPCTQDDECNPGGFNSGTPTKVCNNDGRCVNQPP